MPDFEMTFKGDEAKLLNSLLKVNTQYTQLKQKARETGEESKKGASEFSAFGDNVAGTVSSMAIGFASITTAISTAQEMWRDWNEQIEKTGTTMNTFSSDLTTLVTGRGDAFGAIQPELMKIAQDANLTREETLNLYNAIGGARPLAETSELTPLLQEAAKFRQIGQDPGQLGGFMAVLQEQVMPGAQPEELSNVALAMMQMSGDRAQQLMSNRTLQTMGQLSQVGFQGEDAASLMLSTVIARQRPDFLQQMVGMAVTGVEAPKMPPRGAQVSDAQRERLGVQLRYSQMGPEDFFRSLLEDESAQKVFLGETSVAKLNAVKEAQAIADPKFRAALEGDLFGRTLSELETNPDFRRQERARVANAQSDVAPLVGGAVADERADMHTFFQEEQTKVDREVAHGLRTPLGGRLAMQQTRAEVLLGRGLQAAGPLGQLAISQFGGPAAQVLVGQRGDPFAQRGFARYQAAMGGRRPQGRNSEDAPADEGDGPVAGRVATGEAGLRLEAMRLAKNLEKVNNEVERAGNEGRHVEMPIRE